MAKTKQNTNEEDYILTFETIVFLIITGFILLFIFVFSEQFIKAILFFVSFFLKIITSILTVASSSFIIYLNVILSLLMFFLVVTLVIMASILIKKKRALKKLKNKKSNNLVGKMRLVVKENFMIFMPFFLSLVISFLLIRDGLGGKNENFIVSLIVIMISLILYNLFREHIIKINKKMRVLILNKLKKKTLKGGKKQNGKNKTKMVM